MNIAIIGTQGSGKTQLAQALLQHFQASPPNNTSTPVRVTDSPPLLAAVEADLRFNDLSLYKLALEQHKLFDLTLLLGLDLPQRSEEQQTDESLSCDAVDARLRAVLTANHHNYKVIYGVGTDRSAAALNAIFPTRQERTQPPNSSLGHWQSNCEKCSDPVCEHRLFTGRLQIGSR
jgi:HTH-type transcriptional repressor of NAD biosynthesis genes